MYVGHAPATTPPTVTESNKSTITHLHTITPSYEHSWTKSPWYWTALSVTFFILFFFQPHSWRVALWSQVRPLIPDERVFLLVAAVTVHTFVFVGSNLVMTLIYWLEHPFFEQFKIQPKSWPWKRGQEEREQYFSLIKKSILLVGLNSYVIAPVMIWLSYHDQKKLGMNGDLDKVPQWYTSMLHIMISMVIEDTLFYWAHRTLHHPLIYGYVHKVHHQYKTSIGIASEYAHPIEFIFSNAIPFTVGPMICGMHYFTFFMWSLLRIGETVDGHSGYEFPWSPFRLLPLSGSATGHEFHHSHNVGNYGSFFSYWDRIMGTDASFLKHEERIIQTEREIIQQRETAQAAGKLPVTNSITFDSYATIASNAPATTITQSPSPTASPIVTSPSADAVAVAASEEIQSPVSAGLRTRPKRSSSSSKKKSKRAE